MFKVLQTSGLVKKISTDFRMHPKIKWHCWYFVNTDIDTDLL